MTCYVNNVSVNKKRENGSILVAALILGGM